MLMPAMPTPIGTPVCLIEKNRPRRWAGECRPRSSDRQSDPGPDGQTVGVCAGVGNQQPGQRGSQQAKHAGCKCQLAYADRPMACSECARRQAKAHCRPVGQPHKPADLRGRYAERGPGQWGQNRCSGHGHRGGSLNRQRARQREHGPCRLRLGSQFSLRNLGGPERGFRRGLMS